MTKNDIIFRLEACLSNTSEKEIKERNANGEFHYIPLDNNKFQQQLDVAIGLLRNNDRLKFIDVGCGIGTKVMIAAGDYEIEAYGIEVSAKYVEIAKRLTSNTRCNGHDKDQEERILWGDARKHNYRTYDIIYFYCPMMDGEKQIQLEHRIISTAKKGALILANLHRSHSWGIGKTQRVWRDTIFRKV